MINLVILLGYCLKIFEIL